MDENQLPKKPLIAHVPASELKEGEDFYINDKGLFVFTAVYHLKRGYCCENGCLHCPYNFKNKKSK
jgi:Family of unknown function (DUF5522)